MIICIWNVLDYDFYYSLLCSWNFVIVEGKVIIGEIFNIRYKFLNFFLIFRNFYFQFKSSTNYFARYLYSFSILLSFIILIMKFCDTKIANSRVKIRKIISLNTLRNSFNCLKYKFYHCLLYAFVFSLNYDWNTEIAI